MNDRDARRAKEIFQRALELDPEQRHPFVVGECAENDELRNNVESLLAALEGAGDFLGAPTGGGTDVVQQDSPAIEHPETVGPYRILEPIGEGGMGIVYLAEQTEPVSRRVALKLIKVGMDSREVLARFDAERHALSIMSHSNIATIHDAGTTTEGRPYFVMEFVPGVALTEYCDKERLPLEKRIDLFVDVCHAVQHAHQKGIVHRDLKPNNILVTLENDRPVPKIIDFGVAKATAQALTEETLFTQLGQLIGTPEYMSPEQADASDIDTRSDVYSLGVILYQLLVGVLPFDSETLRRGGYAEIQRVIRDVMPQKPSTRLGADSNIAATNRRTDTRTLEKRLHGDLDWIVMKSLEKERARRYDSAAELGADLRRYLQREPVLAGPPTAAYRMKKFVTRNRGFVAAAVTVFVLLAVGLMTSTGFWWRSQENFELAEKRYLEIRRLSDLKRLGDYVEEARLLWPAHPDRAVAMSTWIQKAEKLADRLALHEQSLKKLRVLAAPYTEEDARRDHEAHPRAGELENLRATLAANRSELSKLESKADEAQLKRLRERVESFEKKVETLVTEIESQRTWNLPDVETQWQHDNLLLLVDRLRGFAETDRHRSVLANVRYRIEFAQEIKARSIDAHRELWNEAIASIADPAECPKYEGLEIEAQMGLVPLARDPDSGLWEFAHLQTGEPPERDGAGKLIITEQTGLVFVLVPGGSFRMGSSAPSLGFELSRSDDGQLSVTEVPPDSRSDKLGIRVGDILLSINGLETKSESDLNHAGALLSVRDRLTATVLRDGVKVELSTSIEEKNYTLGATLDEGPEHTVTLDPFFMSKYEMTQGQWLGFMGSNPSNYAPGSRAGKNDYTLAHPVEHVTWNDCREIMMCLGLRLPTEAQWEYTARAGTRTPWWTGPHAPSLDGAVNLADSHLRKFGGRADWQYEMWLDDSSSTHAPVGSYRANPWGLHDVVGNVSEWCLEGYGSYQSAVAPGTGERQPPLADFKILRDGSWFHNAVGSRTGFRNKSTPDRLDGTLGLRPVRSLDR